MGALSPLSVHEAVIAATEAARRSERGASEPRFHAYASSGHECPRQVALDLSNPENVDASFGDGSALRMRYGNTRELEIRRLLEDAGPFHSPPFEIRDFQSRVELYSSSVLGSEAGLEPDDVPDYQRELAISGKMEFTFHVHGGETIAAEIKAGMAARAIRDLESGLDQHWGRHYLTQLGTYMAAKGLDMGWLVVDHPPSFRTIEVPWVEIRHLVEEFLGNAKASVAWRRGRGEIPEMLPKRRLCSKCPHFQKACFPSLDFGEGIQMFGDEVEQLALERARYQAHARKFKRADDKLKALVRGAEAWVAGCAEGTGKWITVNKAEIPPEIKAQYTVPDPEGQWRSTIRVDPQALRSYVVGDSLDDESDD